MTKSEIKEKISSIRRKLDELRQYKIVMAEEGVLPDRDDKERESELIKQKLRLEKLLAEAEGKAPVTKKKTFPTPRPPKKRVGRRDRSAGKR